MFSKSSLNKQYKLIDKIKRQLLIIELADLHIWRSQLVKHIEKKLN